MCNDFNLQTYVEDVSVTFFGRDFKHCAIWNNRLKSTGGRYHMKTHHLDFNPKIFQEYDRDVFLGIVKHELCHYHLSLMGRGYRHSDKDFKLLLKEVGGSRFAPRLENNQIKYHYRCVSCQHAYDRMRRIDIQKYVCSKCRGQLELVNKQARV